MNRRERLKVKFNIIGMSCSACSNHIEKIVSKQNGVNSVNVSLVNNNMIVDFDKKIITERDIIKVVQSIGYDANTKGGQNKSNLDKMKHRVIISFIFLIPLMYVAMGHMAGFSLPHILHKNLLLFSLLQLILVVPIVFVNRKYYTSGFKALIKRAPNMDSLIAIGSFASIAYGIFSIYKIWQGENIYAMNLYFESAGMILALITLGKYLETKAKEKTSNAINKLLDLTPKKVTILKEEKEIEVPIEEVKVGDIIVVKPGETIAVDGVIVKGQTYIDESSITGEHVPIKKEIGNKVISGSINKNGAIEFRAEKVGEDTTISQIIKLVEEASASKAPIGRLADKVSRSFCTNCNYNSSNCNSYLVIIRISV